MSWLRLYTDILNDPKVQRLEPALFKAWINLLCLAKEHDGKLPSIPDIAFALREQEETVAMWLGALMTKGLIDQTEENLEPHNWNSRQFKSDASAERTQKWREKKRDVSTDKPCDNVVTSQVTPPEYRDRVQKQKEDPPTPHGGRAAKSSVSKFRLPDFVPAEPWNSYVEMRGKLRKPLTDRAAELAVAELAALQAKGHDPTAVLEQSVMNGWQGLFEIKGKNGINGYGKPEKSKLERAAESIRAANAGGFTERSG